jgi:hypothetical protein
VATARGIAEVLRDLDAVQDHLAYRLPVAPNARSASASVRSMPRGTRSTMPGQCSLGSCSSRPRFGASFDVRSALPGGLLKMFKKLAPDAPGRVGNDAGEAIVQRQRCSGCVERRIELVHDAITRARDRAE